MYHKAKNTLASLAIAVSMLGVSYSIGGAPIQVVEGASSQKVEFESTAIEAGLENLTAERKRARGMRSQLSMPFYSFATLLPKRES
jgi:hypothetical protein